MSRLAEKLVVDYWLKPAIPTDLLLDQFAFKLSGSTTCASIQLLDFVSLSLDRPGCSFVRALLIDFAKAFDTVDHSILITKLNTLDLVPSIKNWIISFLYNRSQIVKFNDTKSSLTSINRGVVQGSALGPFLFLLMASDFKTLSKENILVKYADDLTLLVPENSDVSLNEEFNNIKQKAVENKLTINFPKTKEIILSAKRKLVCRPRATFDEIEAVDQVRLLGVILDHKLTFKSHVDFLLSTCNQRFYLLKTLKNQGMPINCLHTVYLSLVVNRIVYCVSAWGGFVGDGDIAKIDSIFRKAKKYGYTRELYDFRGLINYHDANMFQKMAFNNHCLHHLLPPPRQTNNIFLRDRGHSFTLPKFNSLTYRKSFVPRVVYDTT